MDLLALRRGVPERGVWIAGEHCAPFVALGTVTGEFALPFGCCCALLTGCRGLVEWRARGEETC